MKNVQTPIPLSEREPEFPCWLFDSNVKVWSHSDNVDKRFGKHVHPAYLYWLPDSPTAPEVVPEMTNNSVAQESTSEGLPSSAQGTACATASQAPASEAGTPRTDEVHAKCEHLMWHKMYEHMHDHAEKLELELAEATRERDRLNDIITGVFPETAALHEILHRAGCVSVSKSDYDELQQFRAFRPTAEQIEACAREINRENRLLLAERGTLSALGIYAILTRHFNPEKK